MKYYDITQMTAQEVFDASVSHVIEQGEQSRNAGVCKYRSKDGLLVCAAGIFLTDGEARAADEVSALWVNLYGCEGCVSMFPRLKGSYDRLIRGLQRAHDDSQKGKRFVDDFILDVKLLAVSHNLEWNHERA